MGELPRLDVPCQRCGWKYVGFHVCFDASKPCPGEGVLDPGAKRSKKKSKKDSSKVSQSVGDRWERYHEENRERDEQIIELYKDDHTLSQIAEIFKISNATVMKVIKREEAATGEQIMRPRGVNARWSQKEVAGGFI